MARKILFVNRFFYPDQSATSQMLTDLTFHLVKKGQQIIVVTSRQLIDDPEAGLESFEEVDGVHILRVWTTSFGRGRLIGRAIDYLSFYVSALFCLLKHVKAHDIVVAKTDPPLISLIAAIVVKIKGAILVNWLQDIFPEVALGLKVKGTSYIAPALAYLRNKTLCLAKDNVVLGEKMAEIVSEKTQGKAKTTIISNWSDGESIVPVGTDNNSLRKSWGLDEKFVVGYSGNFGRAHDFETILQAAYLLKDDKNIQFLFIGSGAQKVLLEKRFNDLNIQNVMFQPFQDRSMLAESLSCPDVHLISLLPILEGIVVPSKFYGIAAAGRASLFVGALNGEIARILKDFECGYAVSIGDAEGLAKRIRQLKDTVGLCFKLGVNARLTHDNFYNKELSFREWVKLIGNV